METKVDQAYKGIWATLQIDHKAMTEEQKSHLRNAERELSAAGITFDTGYDLGSGIRDWELDWSLKGASLRNPREPEEK